jgi:hypothetical protein
MGNYIDAEYVKRRCGKTDIDSICRGMGTTEKDLFIADLILEAEDTFNSYLQPYFTIPIPVSGWSKGWALNFFQAVLYERGQTENIPMKYQVKLDDISAKLQKGLKDGTVIPPPDADGNTAVSVNTASGTSFHLFSDVPVMREVDFQTGYYKGLYNSDYFEQD